MHTSNYMHICVYICIYMRLLYVHTHTHTHIYMYTCIHVYMYKYIHVYSFLYICMYMIYMCVDKYAGIHKYRSQEREIYCDQHGSHEMGCFSVRFVCICVFVLCSSILLRGHMGVDTLMCACINLRMYVSFYVLCCMCACRCHVYVDDFVVRTRTCTRACTRVCSML